MQIIGSAGGLPVINKLILPLSAFFSALGGGVRARRVGGGGGNMDRSSGKGLAAIAILAAACVDPPEEKDVLVPCPDTGLDPFPIHFVVLTTSTDPNVPSETNTVQDTIAPLDSAYGPYVGADVFDDGEVDVLNGEFLSDVDGNGINEQVCSPGGGKCGDVRLQRSRVGERAHKHGSLVRRSARAGRSGRFGDAVGRDRGRGRSMRRPAGRARWDDPVLRVRSAGLDHLPGAQQLHPRRLVPPLRRARLRAPAARVRRGRRARDGPRLRPRPRVRHRPDRHHLQQHHAVEAARGQAARPTWPACAT